MSTDIIENKIDKKGNKKKDAEPNAFMKLSMRERVMIVALAIVVVVGGLGFFVVKPMFESLDALREEITLLQDQETQYRSQISQKETFLQQFQDAKGKYELYQTIFFNEMTPEQIDEKITTMIRESGLRPVSLAMSQISSETVPMYDPPTLSITSADTMAPMAATDDLDGEITPVDSGEEMTEGDVPPATPISEDGEGGAYGAYSFVYTVDISAAGNDTNMYKFIDALNANYAIRITSFNYSAPLSEISTPGDILSGTPTQSATEGSVSLQLKLYVFIPGLTPGAGSVE